MTRSFRSAENAANRIIAMAASAAPVKKVAPAPLTVQISPALVLDNKAQHALNTGQAGNTVVMKVSTALTKLKPNFTHNADDLNDP